MRLSDVTKTQKQQFKILLFPLANVLGHVSRTLALAEELCNENCHVFVALSDDYSAIFHLIDDRVQIVSSIEMFTEATKKYGQIHRSVDEIIDEKTVFENSTRLEKTEIVKRGQQLKKIIQRDTEIIEEIRPDAIVLDYHFAPLLIPAVKEIPTFYITHNIGYPSMYRRIYGKNPYPFTESNILMPGISNFENTRETTTNEYEGNQWQACGTFTWNAWESFATNIEKSDIFLFFGSTGCTEQLTPWCIKTVAPFYTVSNAAYGKDAKMIHLASYLKQSALVICHGGHGTVMECIKQQKPMLIIPNNLEQLEIGRQIEKLQLGILFNQHYEDIDPEEFIKSIDSLLKNKTVKKNLKKMSEQLSKKEGATIAAATIMGQLQQKMSKKTIAIQ